MQVSHSRIRPRLALNTLGGAVAASLSMSLLALAPVRSAHAQSATPQACAAAWSATAVYTGGQSASENGVNYVANWWTQGNDPATSSGPAGSGQPWTAQGGCGAAPTPAPTPTPTPSPSGDCDPAWSAVTAYNGGAVVSEEGINYQANWWSQGSDPATHNGPGGSGQP